MSRSVISSSLLLIVASSFGTAPAGDDEKDALRSLFGEWVLKRVEFEGDSLDGVLEGRIVIDGIRFTAEDSSFVHKSEEEGTLDVVRVGDKAVAVDLKGRRKTTDTFGTRTKELVSKELWRVTGEGTLERCLFGATDARAERRPEDFSAEKGDKTVLYVYERSRVGSTE